MFHCRVLVRDYSDGGEVPPVRKTIKEDEMSDGKLIAKKETNALTELAGRLKVSPQSLQATLKETAFKECKTNEQFVAAVIVANTYRLNPILREIYVFPSKQGIVPIIPIDGWISLVNRNPEYDGVDLVENKDDESKGGVASVTATFHLKNRSHPVVVTEYMSECYDGSKEPWKRWPIRMLRHKAFIQGARIAFGFSGIYDEDEADRIFDAVSADNPKAGVEAPKPEKQESDGKTKSKFAEMLSQFELMKTAIGDQKYYEILFDHQYTHSNQISSIEEGNKILDEMRKVK